MNTTADQPNYATSWKQEVNRRIAAHQNRRGMYTAKQPSAPAAARQPNHSRAAQIAARVAARYAQVPSFSQMQEAAQPAQRLDPEPILDFSLGASSATFQEAFALEPISSSLDTPPLIAATSVPSVYAVGNALAVALEVEPAAALALDEPAALSDREAEWSHLLWASDSALRPPEAALLHTPPQRAVFSAQKAIAYPSQEERKQPLSAESSHFEEILPVEAVLPIAANLIEFPRELVAHRRVRPRRAEGPFAQTETLRQLSIFEVDPGDLSTEPEAAAAEPAWREPEWPGIELEAEDGHVDQAAAGDAPLVLEPLDPAPIASRLTAVLMDCIFIAGAFLAAALMAVAGIGYRPSGRSLELAAVTTLLIIGTLYHALFLALAETTPGMMCAGLSLCTFDGQIPTRAQVRHRLIAMVISIVPVGLGVAWALFDEDRLSWHDRLSSTYPRKG